MFFHVSFTLLVRLFWTLLDHFSGPPTPKQMSKGVGEPQNPTLNVQIRDSKSKRDTKNCILVSISGNMLCSSEKYFGLYFPENSIRNILFHFSLLDSSLYTLKYTLENILITYITKCNVQLIWHKRKVYSLSNVQYYCHHCTLRNSNNTLEPKYIFSAILFLNNVFLKYGIDEIS